MNLTAALWIFCSFSLGLAGQPTPPATAVESPSELNCTVKPQPDGTVVYQLSRLTSSSSCEPGWEDRNKIALAQVSIFDPKLVQDLTSLSITMKRCQDFLHYTNGCLDDFEEADCSVNCSLLLAKGLLSPAGNSTSTCFFEVWCLDPLNVGLSILGVLLLAAGVCLSLWYLFKHRRGQSAAQTTSYTPANEEIKIVIE